MGCGASVDEKSSLNPKRISVDSDLGFPDYWGEEDITKSHRKVVQCHETDLEEKKAIQELLDNTLLPSAQHRCVADVVLRVEDSHMWDEYKRSITYIADMRGDEANALNAGGALATTRSGTMEGLPLTTQKLPKAFQDRLAAEANETYLWHATPRKYAEMIIKDDFSTRGSGSANGQVLGKGIYLAESCSLSDEYAVPGPVQGRYCMLLVRATLGKVHATRRFSKWRGKKLVMTTFTTRLVKAGECDSVLGDRERAGRAGVREYVVANREQLYPEYLILYNREARSAEKPSS